MQITTRRRFERRGIERRIQNRQEERFIKNLEEARDALSDIIEDVEMGRTDDIMDALEAVDVRLNRVHRQAEVVRSRC